MAVFKCKLCGGTIEPRDGGIGICDSCGTKQTIPNTNDEKKMNLLDRANHFRMQNEFDKAMGIYEQVLEEDSEDSDIYYAIALCRYGITYVDDSKTKKKIPTINRMQNKMFTKDADFVMAINKARPEQAKLYIDEGEYIDKVQNGILDITKNEKPYDVFICYKETDDNGERTRDSVLSNELYYGLTNEGFKVFFARITLEGKLGTAYEPYIFSALNSSKVMVVIGTKKEYFNAAWVKNEWSRFLTLINDGANKVLIPAYKDMDPYDLPDEFANIQAQDMSKLGFMQDLIRGIKKILGGKNEIKDSGSNNNQVNSLLKRVKLFLEDGDFDKAKEYCEKALDIDAENSDIYLYYWLVEMKSKSIEKLIKMDPSITNNLKYEKALKFANEKQMKQLMDIKNENIYYNSNILFDNNNYLKAKEMFSSIKEFKDSKNKISECNERIYNNAMKFFDMSGYNKAIEIFKTIPDYKDSKEKINECMELEKPNIYEMAISQMHIGEYQIAINTFNQIIDYKDVKEKIKECENSINQLLYENAINQMREGKYQIAINSFNQIIDYKDVKEKIKECEDSVNQLLYENALKMIDKEKYTNAMNILNKIQNFKDASYKIQICVDGINSKKYKKALQLYRERRFETAYLFFKEIIDYKDAKRMCFECAESSEAVKEKYGIEINKIKSELNEDNDIMGIDRIKEDNDIVGINRIKGEIEDRKKIIEEQIKKTKEIPNKIIGKLLGKVNKNNEEDM